MNDYATSRDQLERELAYYKQEYNEVGARLLRLQEDQSRVAREARRSKIVASLVREAYLLIGQEIPPETIGKIILATIADTSLCDCAAFLVRDPVVRERFVVEHAFGTVKDTSLVLATPPAYLYTSAKQAPVPESGEMSGLLGVPYVLWAYDSDQGRALLLGNKTETNIHRAFEAGDRELIEAALAVYIDVLQRKAAVTALRLAKQAAEDANNVRARFLATLSHEFRSPLEAIIGFSELLLQSGFRVLTPEQHNEFTHQILDSGHRLLTLVQDILDFSSFENSEPVLRRDWVPIFHLLQNAVRGFAATAAACNIRIEIAPLELHWQVSIDYERFRQILSNLIGNALKFTAPGGKIIVAALITGQNGVTITVADNGIGIEPHAIERVVEPFVQIATPDGHRATGAGLGLPIAKQLAAAHEGTLMIDSLPGEGTTVTISLPPGTARRAVKSP
ncbi:MAG: HAMP domain-containing sensor histidine kinase [Acidiphilium sp.]|nr:HAMP domain-containing sensor histidine kinase [Acidiphilium sp.]MDD4936463.1 HAMP domain-containing sensor histidine kinase [Acidiphilium sp.]